MVVNMQDDYLIAHLYNEIPIQLDESKEWSFWMRTMQNHASNTVIKYMSSLERFWIWSLYNPVKENEKLPFYQARYREALKKGFEIVEKLSIYDREYETVIYSSKPLSKATINNQFAGIKSYFKFIEEDSLMTNQSKINKQYEKRKSENSFLSSIQAHQAKVTYELTAKKEEFLRSYRLTKRSSKNKKDFPFKYFDLLLEAAKPRERMIYLLCGACSARIGQTLNLTIYDLDYEKKDVWLFDPQGDDIDLNGNVRSQWLLEEYGIDTIKDKPHSSNDLQFKYPIPNEYEPLTWLDEKYIDVFFKALLDYTKSKYYVPESARTNRHPFMFVTQTGNRLRSSELNRRMKTTARKIMEKHNIEEDLTVYSLHSLRHMFGHYMAKLYANTGNDAIIKITQNAMGHSSLASTLIYFQLDYETKKRLIQKAKENAEKKLKAGVR